MSFEQENTVVNATTTSGVGRERLAEIVNELVGGLTQKQQGERDVVSLYAGSFGLVLAGFGRNVHFLVSGKETEDWSLSVVIMTVAAWLLWGFTVLPTGELNAIGLHQLVLYSPLLFLLVMAYRHYRWRELYKQICGNLGIESDRYYGATTLTWSWSNSLLRAGTLFKSRLLKIYLGTWCLLWFGSGVYAFYRGESDLSFSVFVIMVFALLAWWRSEDALLSMASHVKEVGQAFENYCQTELGKPLYQG